MSPLQTEMFAKGFFLNMSVKTCVQGSAFAKDLDRMAFLGNIITLRPTKLAHVSPKSTKNIQTVFDDLLINRATIIKKF